MIEFYRVISESEVQTTYLNLTDERGRTFGAKFPPHKTRLAIVDAQGRVTSAQKHHDTQIWGSISNWFRDNDVQPGAKVLVRYDPKERKDGFPVVYLLPQPPASQQLEELPKSDPAEAPAEIPISLERQLEDFLAGKLDLIEQGLRLYVDEDGREGRQYPTDVGRLDLICCRPNGDFLVIELKRGKGSDAVVGQISRYMGWVKKNIAGEKSVFGLILTHDRDESLKYAILANDKLILRYFKLRLELVSEDQL